MGDGERAREERTDPRPLSASHLASLRDEEDASGRRLRKYRLPTVPLPPYQLSGITQM